MSIKINGKEIKQIKIAGKEISLGKVNGHTVWSGGQDCTLEYIVITVILLIVLEIC